MDMEMDKVVCAHKLRQIEFVSREEKCIFQEEVRFYKSKIL